MDFLKNIGSGIQDVWNRITGKSQTATQQSPSSSTGQFIGAGPAVYNQQQASSGLYKPGFQGPVPMPQTPQYPILPSNDYQGGGGDSSVQTQNFNMEDWISSFLNSLKDPMEAEIDSWWKKLDEYDKNNPFAFDEALARASSQERLNPYYDATLNEFMTGVRRSSARSVEDMTRTIGELNVDASKLSEKERLSTQEAIRSSEEGFAGAGLFFSGKNQRATGLQEVQGQQTQEGIQTNLERGLATSARSNTRLQEDLALQTARQNRLTEAERTTSLETDIAKQKKEAEMQRALEQVQFAGRGTNLSTAQRMTLENQFLPGLT